jgi:DNA-directed RNA polymerase specialized sigma24 family protein
VPGTLQEGGASFGTTHWTLVLRAAQIQSTESTQEALSAFCEAYWPPLYAFLRHRRYSSPDAQDLVQAFFAHLLAQNTLSRADQMKGRFRTFLLGSLQNFLINEHDRARALKLHHGAPRPSFLLLRRVGARRSGNVKRLAAAVGEGSIAISLVHQVLRE